MRARIGEALVADFFAAAGFAVDFFAGGFFVGDFAAVVFFVVLLEADFFERAGAIGHSIWSI